jgi:hypothetical protein
MIRSLSFRLYALLLLAVMSSGCELIEGVFKAGMWVGILLVLLVVGVLVMAFRRLGG